MKLTIPHWVIVIVTLVGTVAPQVGQAFPALAPAMAIVVQLATLVVGALGMITGSALKPGTAASAAVKPLTMLGVLVLAVAGFGANCQPPSPQVVNDVNGGLTLGACMWGVYAHDEAQAPPAPWSQVAVDMGATCGADVVQIVTLFGSSSPLGQAAVANAGAVHAAAAQHTGH
jgi:hypothetical protein